MFFEWHLIMRIVRKGGKYANLQLLINQMKKLSKKTDKFFLNIFWCDLPLLAVFIIIAVSLPSSGPSYPSSF
jgi:hypothetical protein